MIAALHRAANEGTMTMHRIDLAFLLLASLCLVGGVYLGMRMGFQHDYSLAPVHVHLNLVGWASLALYGLAYRAFPELRASPLAALHFALAAPSGVLFPLSIYLSMNGQPLASLLTAPAWFLGAVAFAANVGRAMLADPRKAPAPAGLAAARRAPLS
jgi:hypothetical protein